MELKKIRMALMWTYFAKVSSVYSVLLGLKMKAAGFLLGEFTLSVGTFSEFLS